MLVTNKVTTEKEKIEISEKTKRKVDDRFGLCPECHGEPELLNVEKSHYAVCEEHKYYWGIGYNLFFSWEHETEADWDSNEFYLYTCREVEPYLSESQKAVQAANSSESIMMKIQHAIIFRLIWTTSRMAWIWISFQNTFRKRMLVTTEPKAGERQQSSKPGNMEQTYIETDGSEHSTEEK